MIESATVPQGFQGALAAGDGAAGLARLRPGFGKTAADDRLFALGYPRLVLLDDSAVPNPADATGLQRLIAQHHDTLVVPRSHAERTVRTLPLALDAPGRLAAWPGSAGALRDDELRPLAEEALFSFGGLRHLNVLEALVGTSRLLPLIVETLEQEEETPDAWTEGPIETNAGNLPALYGFLLRAPRGAASAARERLDAVVERRLAVEGAELWRPTMELDLILNGRAALERRKQAPELQDLVFVDDAAWVAEHALPLLAAMAAGDRQIPDARLAFVGGPAVTRAWLATEARWQPEFQAAFREQGARIA